MNVSFIRKKSKFIPTWHPARITAWIIKSQHSNPSLSGSKGLLRCIFLIKPLFEVKEKLISILALICLPLHYPSGLDSFRLLNSRLNSKPSRDNRVEPPEPKGLKLTSLVIFLWVYTATQSPALSNISANSEILGTSIPNCKQQNRQAVSFAFTFWTNSARMCVEVAMQNMQFLSLCHVPLIICRMRRKAWVFWVVAAIQVPAADSAARKHWGMFGCFGWHLTQERTTDFIVRPEKSVKKFTFTFWILDKLQLYFICTQVLNSPPV